MKTLLAALALLLAAAGQAAPRVAPQDAAVLAATCFTCHGPNGQPPGNMPGGIPALRGRSAAYLLQRMRAFKAQGARDAGGADAGATIMPLLLQGYGDAQIEVLAQALAALAQVP